MDLHTNRDCRNCFYYRAVTRNLTALRWVTLVLATVLPLLMITADILSEWHLDANHVALYSVGVLGLVGIAFLGGRVKVT